MPRIRRTSAAFLPDQKQYLVAGIHQRVDRLGEHRGRSGNPRAINFANAMARLPVSATMITRVEPLAMMRPSRMAPSFQTPSIGIGYHPKPTELADQCPSMNEV